MVLRFEQRNSTTYPPMEVPIVTTSRARRELIPTQISQFPHIKRRRLDQEREHIHTLGATPEFLSDPEVLS